MHSAKTSARRLLSLMAVATAFILASDKSFSAQAIPARIKADPSQRFQTMDGFGVNFNGTYFRDSQRPMIDLLVKDLGATLFRLDPYGLANWEAVNDNNDANVMDWEYYHDRYSIPEFEAAWAASRYLNSLGIRPYLTLSGTPPAWMLNEDLNPPKFAVCSKDSKSHLNPQMYEEYAETVVSLAMYARNTAHVDFQYFGPFNETDCYPAEGPRVDPEEMPIVLNTIAKRLKKEGLGDVKIVAAEQSQMRNNYIEEILKNQELMPSVGAFSLHSYGDTNDAAPHVKAVKESTYPDIPVWLTEYGELDDLNQSAENEWRGFSLAAMRRALRAISQGVTAAVFWDAFDNYHEHYPRMTYYGLFANHNHYYQPKKRYYAAKQLFHFVHVGAQRIGVEASSGMLLSAFQNGDDGSVVVVGMQEGGPETVTVDLAGSEGEWRVFQTTRRLNCELTGRTVIANGSAQVHLYRDSIYTLLLTREKN